ncbi:hypothetical protein LTR09_001666 [Extremus antarcticus]|uniref:Uncharacterized protein n=1 Tax=Extremus antarcticus TaxID=702011 RepID=A0AAJ0LW42_9PEZI|nr:hypothetical protein LTR09_001666 [Extremus antarcticus]
MSEQKAFYIVTVAGGKCLENTARGVLDCLPKDSNKSQHWVVEAGEEANTVAFKNVADGQYLRNNEPNKINWGKIGVGEKQWWTLEQGKTPGSCAIRSNACTSGKSYLNDFQGKYQDNNYVHMWQMEKSLEFWLTWYLKDAADSASFNPTQAKANAESDDSELKAREKAVAEKEEELKKMTADQKSKSDTSDEDLKAREKALAEKDEELKKLIEDQKSKSDLSAEDLKAREKALTEKEEELKKLEEQKKKDLEQREAALKKKEQELADQQAAQKKSASEPAAKPQQPKQPAPKAAPPPKAAPAAPRDCGHKVYTPPRKLNRKVVGYLYDGAKAH